MVRKLVLFFVALCLTVSLMPAPKAFAQVKFSGGLYERLRHEYWANNWDFNSQTPSTTAGKGDRNFFRFKTSAWGQMDYGQLATLYAKLTDEIKSYAYYGGNAKKGITGDTDEVIFDNLYLDIKKPAGLPVSFRLGRQDFLNQYGEGFLIQDGTPGDGSRTYYFNAAKASWMVDGKNTLDAIYLNDPINDDYLPVIDKNKGETALELSDETGFILDLKNRNIENLLFEPYYIYKREGAGASGLQQNESSIDTFGGFAKYTTAPWTLHLQLAGQRGKYGTEERKALGGYAMLDREFKSITMDPVLSAGYFYLSGDDKNTSKNEGWDPLFCRFPIWSEIYAQEYTGESGNSYWTNLSMIRTQLLLTLCQKAKVTLNYSYLRALELVPASATYGFSGKGKNRGALYQAKLDYTFNKNVSAYILGEFFHPGNFYASDSDNAVFVRTQLEIKF